MNFSINFFHWLSLGCLFIILDLATGVSFFLLWLGISAFTVAIVLFLLPNLLIEYQLLLFAVQSLASIIFWSLYLRYSSSLSESDHPFLNQRLERYIGMVFVLSEPIVNNQGRLHIEDCIWKIEGPNLPINKKIKIVDLRANTLIVEEFNG